MDFKIFKNSILGYIEYIKVFLKKDIQFLYNKQQKEIVIKNKINGIYKVVITFYTHNIKNGVKTSVFDNYYVININLIKAKNLEYKINKNEIIFIIKDLNDLSSFFNILEQSKFFN